MLAAMVNEPGFFSPDPKAGAAYQRPGGPLALRAQGHGQAWAR